MVFQHNIAPFCCIVDQLYIHPRQLLTRALDMSARGIILLHNHPSGSPVPSPADIQLTRAIKIAASAVRLDVVDHIIIARNACFSITANELIPLDRPFAQPPKKAEKPKGMTPEEKRAAAFSELAKLSAIHDLKDCGEMTRDSDFQIDDRVLFLIRQSKPVPCDLHNKREPFPVPRVAEHLVFRVSQPRKIVFRMIFLHDIPPQLFPVHARSPVFSLRII